MNNRLFKISKFVFHEVFLDAQLETAGSNQSKVLERLEKNAKTMKTQAILIKVVYTIIFIFLPIMPLIVYFQLSNFLTILTLPLETAIFTASFLFFIFFGMTLIYLIVFGLMNTSSFMKGDVFEWLNTLPLSEENLKRVSFFTIFRSLDIPLIIMIIAFPVIMGIGTRDILLIISASITSIVTVIFNFCILILIGERLSRVLDTSSPKDKKSSAIRIATLLGFILISMSTGFFINWAFSSIEFFFQAFSSLENANLFNYLLSLIPFPFAPAYLMALTSIPTITDLSLWITTIIGMFLFILITYFIYKKAINSLKQITYPEGEKAEIISKPKIMSDRRLEIRVITPIKSYLKKDLVTASRDFQTFMFLIMPLMIPIIMTFSFIFALENSTGDGIYYLIVSLTILLNSVYISAMLVSGLLTMEETGATIMASLPVIPRERAKSKLYLLFFIQTLSHVIPNIILFIVLQSVQIFLIGFIFSIVVWNILLNTFLLKIRLFGKMKNKYTIEEINKNHKIGKWILMILVQTGIFVGYAALILSLTVNYNLRFAISIIGLIGLGVFGLQFFIFDKMFPKIKLK
jgi:predicted permease